MRLSNAEAQTIINACTYKHGWEILYTGDFESGTAVLQLSISKDVGRDSMSGNPVAWKSGKRNLSRFMCRQELVGAVFGLIKDAELHEMREFFRYKGASIFNPHLDPDALVEMAKKASSFNCRENAMSMAEVQPTTVGQQVMDVAMNHLFGRK